MRQNLFLLALISLAGCQRPASSHIATGPQSERGGIGIQSIGGGGGTPPTIDPRRSLAVTDVAILSQFSLGEVLDTLAAQSGGGITGTQLFRQWWDTANAAPGAGSGGPHCDAASNPGINRYSYQCPRNEGRQAFASSGVESTPAAYTAVGLFNRFDLAPADGSNCGEYRIAFAKTSGAVLGGRNLAIFEAVLPNPTPSSGLAGCGAVAQFWTDLSTDGSVTSRATKLHDFYFNGLSGFSPVVHIDHYGAGPAGLGQIRTNQFITFDWLLREFKLARCGAGCGVTVTPVTVKVNPFGPLFDPASTRPEAPAFRTAFAGAVDGLAVNDVNRFAYALDDSFNAAESDEQSSVNDYRAQLGSGASALRGAIQSRLTAIGSSLTPDDIVVRATALSCAGCHQLSNGAPLGGGVTWPSSLGFTHVSEFTENGPDGPRFQLSSAVTNVFLPHRAQVLSNFVASIAPPACGKNTFNCCGVCIDASQGCPIVCPPPTQDQ